MSVIDILFSFKGRIRRLHFWLYVLGVWAISTGSVFALFALRPDMWMSQGTIIFSLLQVTLFWSHLAVLTKRWHDRGKSGWWSLIMIIPIIGFFYTLIECGLMDGEPSSNQYGSSPKNI
jgi:uncharacterized membrane protein YhaH (DUF805 family)